MNQHSCGTRFWVERLLLPPARGRSGRLRHRAGAVKPAEYAGADCRSTRPFSAKTLQCDRGCPSARCAIDCLRTGSVTWTAEATARPLLASGTSSPPLVVALAIVAVAVATLAGAWFFSAGAGHQALSALPRAALCLLSGGAARGLVAIGAIRMRRGCCRSRGLVLPAAAALWPPASAAITPASSGVLAGADRMHRADRRSR